jgi:hypothetical protein
MTERQPSARDTGYLLLGLALADKVQLTKEGQVHELTPEDQQALLQVAELWQRMKGVNLGLQLRDGRGRS